MLMPLKWSIVSTININVHKGNQNCATLKLLFGILILSCLLRNKPQKELLALPLFPAQEIWRKLIKEGNFKMLPYLI